MLSPSKRYKLDVAIYKVKDEGNYTNGIITKLDDDKVIAVIDKVGDFNFLWFTQNNIEWLHTGQIFINLNSGEIFDHRKLADNFNWIKSYASPNADILAVFNNCGCKFFDISDIGKKYYELKLNLVDRCEAFYEYKCEWIDHKTFVLEDIKSIRTFRRNYNEMVNIKVVEKNVLKFLL